MKLCEEEKAAILLNSRTIQSSKRMDVDHGTDIRHTVLCATGCSRITKGKPMTVSLTFTVIFYECMELPDFDLVWSGLSNVAVCRSLLRT